MGASTLPNQKGLHTPINKTSLNGTNKEQDPAEQSGLCQGPAAAAAVLTVTFQVKKKEDALKSGGGGPPTQRYKWALQEAPWPQSPTLM